MSEEETFDPADPYSAHIHRDPVSDAGVQVLLLTTLPGESADAIVTSIITQLRSMGRPADALTIDMSDAASRLSDALCSVLGQAAHPLVLITTAGEPFSPGHLGPLLEAIDRSDHVVGKHRPEDGRASSAGWGACRGNSSSPFPSSTSIRPAVCTGGSSSARSPCNLDPRSSTWRSWPRRRSWATCCARWMYRRSRPQAFRRDGGMT